MSRTRNSGAGPQAQHRELPYADKPIASKNNPWSWLRTAAGKTASESKLLELARVSMLSLWSIPGPYTNEGLARSGRGAELCDLMVIFGDDVLLFSDKDCAFPQHPNTEIAWSRWYRRAIEKSARQLAGAAASVRRPGTRLFSEPACTSELPLRLPPPDRIRIHLIAVAHGSVPAAERYWEGYGGQPGSSGSLFFSSKLAGSDHRHQPFHVGWPIGREEFIHVLDDLTLPLLLKELDTVADLTDYLTKKERLLRTPGCDFVISGEEELLTMYLSTVPDGRTHQFPAIEEGAVVVLREGTWTAFRASPEYAARVAANSLSYLWDNLIEYQASHVIHGSTEEIFAGHGEPSAVTNERVLRAMASETRLSRRSLSATLREGRAVSSNQKRWMRTIAMPDRRRLYCFAFVPYFPQQQLHAEYRDYRQYLLYLYCRGALLKFERAKEIIGIAPDPYDSGIASVDFMFFNVRDSSISSDDRLELEKQLHKENIWNTTVLRARTFYDVTYPYSPTMLERIRHMGKRLVDKALRRGPRS
jgi:hypothetical protein